MKGQTCVVGVISDTHGLLRPEVLDHFAGVEHIVHAGDVGPPSIIADLETVAPVTAVWGNTDGFEIRSRVPEVGKTEVCGSAILVVHGHRLGSPDPRLLAEAYPQGDIVIFGHTHRRTSEWVGGRLFLNPGSAGAPRFGQPASLALLVLGSGSPQVRFIDL